ncbi:MAG: 5'/3'-nucleotidase SurE [Proteobacteria bacterium]|jgi:5''/3''-nucleotidase SurE|nr:MAG: 5'/3'-nucleotidase SurE [Pseudomonadota bacterium]
MRILLTNDDGINAPGLQALKEIALALSDDVWIVAPEIDQSGASHSLTLREPIRMRRIDDKTFAVRGTPADCVIMAIRHLLRDELPTLVLSGVNRGANIADDVTYSGTVAGAIEGTLLGVRSIAMSLACGKDSEIRWDTAIAHGPEIVRRLLAVDWPEGVLMNVNYPDCAPDEVVGIAVTEQGRRDHDLMRIDQRFDTWGNPYYWLGYERKRSNPRGGTDLWAIYSRRVSITPLTINLTARNIAETLSVQLERGPDVQREPGGGSKKK